jgi:hypothetical protein
MHVNVRTNAAPEEKRQLPTFSCSSGWVSKFKKRAGLTKRRATNIKRKQPEDHLPAILNFLRWWRGLQQSEGRVIGRKKIAPPPHCDHLGRWPASTIYNMDQVLIHINIIIIIS